jgi:biopolymer transport protein ExbB
MTGEALNFLDDIGRLLQAGGPIARALLLVAVLLWAMIIERMIYYRREMPKLIRSVHDRWESRAEHDSWYAEKIKRRYIAEANRAIVGPLPLIRAVVALCPLIGLLGTVTGMIRVFEVMAVLGTGNAREMASGVSAATLPTLAGMVVALSGMYPVAHFQHIVESEARRLRDHLAPDHSRGNHGSHTIQN